VQLLAHLNDESIIDSVVIFKLVDDETVDGDCETCAHNTTPLDASKYYHLQIETIINTKFIDKPKYIIDLQKIKFIYF